MSKIGIFGGSFNPIHVGHALIANYIVENSDLDSLWLMVSPLNPLKEGSTMASDYHRLRMTELVTRRMERVITSAFEYDLPKPSYTIDTLNALQAKFPKDEFYLVIGADNWQIFNQWKDWQVILRDFHVIVYPRPGYPLPEEGVKYSTVQWVDAPMFNISSTEIRQRLKLGQSLSDWVDIKVEKFLHHVIAKD